MWNGASNPESTLGPPAVDGETRFACFDPDEQKLTPCVGTCTKGKCSGSQSAAPIAIAASVCVVLVFVGLVVLFIRAAKKKGETNHK